MTALENRPDVPAKPGKQLRIEELEVGRLRVRELEVESERRPE